jgi:hypothetical protein
LLLSCAIADFFRVVIFACHYSRATRPALSQQSGEAAAGGGGGRGGGGAHQGGLRASGRSLF